MSNVPFLQASAADIMQRFEPELSRVENKRRSAIHYICLIFVLCFGVGMIGVPYNEAFQDIVRYMSVCALVAALPTYFTYRVLRRNQWLLYKPVSALIARSLFGNAYKAWGIIEADEIAKHEILPAHCRLYREEGYVLNLHGYHLRFQEIDAVRSSHPDSVREWYEDSVGSGLYVLIRLKRDLPAHTILFSKGKTRTLLKRFLRKNFGRYKPVGLVSPAFSDQFEVLSTDQVTARVAFHPAFLEKFMAITAALNSNDIEASFRQNELLIHARYKRDMFQLGRFFRPLSEMDIDMLIQELRLYGQIVETLKLNPYTAP